MSYAFDKDAKDGDIVTLENGVAYQFDEAKDRWLVKDVAGSGSSSDWGFPLPEDQIEYATLEHSDGRDNALQLQIDELEQEIDVIAPRLDGAQYKYVGAPSVKPGEMHIASGSFTRADDLIFFNDTALDGTTHAWGSLHEGDYLEITDTQNKNSRSAENYAMYLVTQDPEGEGMKQIQVSLVKGSGAPAVDDILDAKGFQLGGNDINDLDSRYIKLGGESELTSSVVVKTAKGKAHNFGLHVQEGQTAFYIKDKQGDPIFKVDADSSVIAGVDEESPFIATKPNHLTTKSYVDDQMSELMKKIGELEMASGTTKSYQFQMYSKYSGSSGGIGNTMNANQVMSCTRRSYEDWTGRDTQALNLGVRFIFISFPDGYQLNSGYMHIAGYESNDRYSRAKPVATCSLSDVEACPPEYANGKNIYRGQIQIDGFWKGDNTAFPSWLDGDQLYITFTHGSLTKTSATTLVPDDKLSEDDE